MNVRAECRLSTGERDWQALRSCCTGQLVVAGDQDEFGIERGHGSGEVNGVVAAQLVGLGEVTSVAGQLGGDLDAVDLGDDRLQFRDGDLVLALGDSPIRSALASAARASG